jgi:hypothetical protein
MAAEKSSTDKVSNPESHEMKAIHKDGSDEEKMPIEQVEHSGNGVQKQRADRMPEILRSMTVEERTALNLRLRKKIDLRLLPMMLLMYIMNYLDRNNIASARLAGKTGLEADLGLKGSEYQVTMSQSPTITPYMY